MSLADDLRGTSEWLAAGNRVSVECAQLLAHRDQQAADRIEALESALRIDEHYPKDVFPPLSEAEVQRCIDALDALDADGHLSERLHAQWARHLAWAARSELGDAPTL